MELRQEQLLNLVIENHIVTAEPIGSKFLVSEGGLDWSEATVRNELRALEEEGYLTHPHTSAGRIPTAKGYRYYVDRLDFSQFDISSKDDHVLRSQLEKSLLSDVKQKQLAKNLAEISAEAVVLAFSPRIIYYTGLSNLFQKPELSEFGLIVNISSLFDRFEDILSGFYDQVGENPKFFIGNEHNLGNVLSVLAVRFGSNFESMIALLGPQRMDYARNYILMRRVLEML